MMSESVRPTLGEGVYTPRDASKILNIPVDRIWRWVGRGISGDWVIEGWSIEGARGMNFLALIELFAIYRLRQLKVPLQRIRTARLELASHLETDFPFAQKGLLSDGRSILYRMQGPGEGAALRLDGSRQTAFTKIVEEFCHRIDFHPETELADSYWPLGRDRSVVVNPHHAFGQPRIDGTNITTEVLASFLLAGESVPNVATLYNLKPEEVRDAQEFESKRAA